MGQASPSLWAFPRPAKLSPQLKTLPGFSLGAALQTQSQQPSHRQGRWKAWLPCFDLQAKPQNERSLSSAEWVLHNMWFKGLLSPFFPLMLCSWRSVWMQHVRFCPLHQRVLSRSCDQSKHPCCVWVWPCLGKLPSYFQTTYLPRQLLSLVSKCSYMTLKLTFISLPEQ